MNIDISTHTDINMDIDTDIDIDIGTNMDTQMDLRFEATSHSDSGWAINSKPPSPRHQQPGLGCIMYMPRESPVTCRETRNVSSTVR